MNETIVRSQKGSIVGRIENKVFIKEVYGSKHLLRMPAAWSIDADIFNNVIDPLCYSIYIIDKETGAKYVTGVKTFSEKRGTLDRGYGKQYYLELIHWEVMK